MTQKDDFHSFMPAVIIIFLGANPTHISWGLIARTLGV